MSAVCRAVFALMAVTVAMLRPVAGYGDELLTPELIEATEPQARAAAELMHEYQRKWNELRRDLDRHGLNLDSGVILSDMYRQQLNELKVKVDRSGATLRSRVIALTGDRKNASKLMFELAYRQAREMYGFANQQELESLLSSRRKTVWIVLLAAAFLVGLFGRRPRGSVHTVIPIAIPPKLQRVRLTGLEYPVGWISGRVMDKEMWTEVKHRYHTFTNFMGFRETHFETDSVTKGRVYLKTHDGQERVYNLYGPEHSFRTGNLITVLNFAKRKGIEFLAVFNHDTKERLDYGLWSANGTPWLINLLVTGVIAYYGFGWSDAIGRSVAAVREPNFWLDAGFAALVAAGLTLLAQLPIGWWRNWHFRRGFLRDADKWLEGELEALRAAFDEE